MKAKDFNALVTPKVNSKFGAPMGRYDKNCVGKHDEIPKTSTRRIYLDRGGYDNGGAYWGLGSPLYATYSKCGKIITYHRKN
jgi:hypothetical protein